MVCKILLEQLFYLCSMALPGCCSSDPLSADLGSWYSIRVFKREQVFMKRSHYFIWLGIAAAAGTALGMLSDRKHPAKGGLLGATAGVVAGSVATGVYHYITADQVPYYSRSSSQYEELDTI